MTEAEGLTDRMAETAAEEPDAGPVAEVLPTLSVDEAKEIIATRGRERGGFVTSEDLLEGLPMEDLTPEQIDDFLSQIYDHLRQEGIEVIEVPGEELEGDGEAISIRLPRDEELLKAPTNDPVRMYLKEIGKVPLLTAAQEVDLAMRIEGGEFATALIQSIDGNGKVDQKHFRRVVDSVVRTREHQLDPEKRLRHEGIGRKKVARSYRPRTRQQAVDFLKRAKRDGQLANKKLIEANLRLVV